MFFYGSLKRGFHNNWIIEPDCKFVGSGVTKPIFQMYSRGMYPVLTRGKKSILGEVFSINDTTLEIIDELEMNGFCYKREPTLVRLTNKQCVNAWIYITIEESLLTNSLLGISLIGNSMSWVGAKL
jgi:gamma-glutamylcyclotransferase (GGCT)/AIG2-like uncharacterized protein YtfP